MFTTKRQIFECLIYVIALNGILTLVTCHSSGSHKLMKRQNGEDDYDDEDADECSKNEFECENGKCIDILKVCDNVVDCTDSPDKTDESTEKCETKTNVTCSMDLSRTTRISCEFKGSSVNVTCGEKVNPWTKVKISCNKGFKPKDDKGFVKESICQDNGKWSHPIPVCEYICGTPMKKEIKLENDDVKTYSHLPWNAFLYRRLGDEYFYVPKCQGLLITPFSVLTSLRCTLSDRYVEKEIQEKDLIVALGKLYVDFNDPRDEATVQKLSVERIRRIGPREYNSNSIVYDTLSHTAILDLKTQVDYNEHVMPACFDTHDQFHPTISSVGYSVLGHGYRHDVSENNNQPYVARSLKYTDLSDCQNYLVNNFNMDPQSVTHGGTLHLNGSFCLSIDNDIKMDRGHRKRSGLGAGITFEFNGKHYVYGLMNNYIGYDLLSATDLREQPHRKYIAEAIETVNNYRLFQLSEKCSVPYSAGTVFSKCADSESCSELSTYKIMDANSPLFINCKENFTYEGNCQFKACSRGSWFPEGEVCIRLCEPLPRLKNVTTECRYKGEVVSCYDMVKNGTVATSYCRIQDQNTNSIPYKNFCEDNGQWRNSPKFMTTICIHKCGILKITTPLIEGGVKANVTEHPWHAGVYYKNITTENMDYICGGTLITRTSVLTAAHCGVIDIVDGEEGIHASLYRIGLGKKFRALGETGEQAYYVNRVHVPEEYIGQTLHFNHDIAIFELDKAASLTNLVLPACIDLANYYDVSPGSYGEVVGFGRRSVNGSQTKNLVKATLPLVARDNCSPLIKSNDGYLTKDKFCAFFQPGESFNISTVRQGDSGSGLTFKRGGRYYVYGIVSLQTYDYISMFTNVTNESNLNFINEILKVISKNRGSESD